MTYTERSPGARRLESGGVQCIGRVKLSAPCLSSGGTGVLPPPTVAKVPRVSFLLVPPRSSPVSKAFREGLHERGYAEGRNVVVEWRGTGGKHDQLPALAADPVNVGADVIVTEA